MQWAKQQKVLRFVTEKKNSSRYYVSIGWKDERWRNLLHGNSAFDIHSNHKAHQ